MTILYGREYYRKYRNRVASGLQPEDVRRCVAAAEKFLANSNRPGLNFERLGSSVRQNHWSIRASKELRVILAVEPSGDRPHRVGFMNMGHHDAMYEWARLRKYHTDLDAYGETCGPPSDGGSAVPPSDFEEWTVYLPEEQRRLVERRYERGMGRIRGAAGTGKTVVALHRAIVLGRRYPDETILVTSFIRSLCNHMRERFGRIPNPPLNVEFVNVDQLARRLDQRDVKQKEVDTAFEAAYVATIPQPDRERLNREYLREEIRRVIKGRDARQDHYLDTGTFERLGRVRSFKLADRTLCWRLREAWDHEMQKRGTVDFADRVIRARDLARESEPTFRAAIVDESQDMTQVQMQFVRALVGGHPHAELRCDAILVLDDAAQRIYPGGFHPKWADLDFQGNSSFLERNFRNTKRIFDAARSVRGEVIVGKDDNDDGASDGVIFDRGEGERPRLIVTQKGEVREIVDGISSLFKEGYQPEEIGVLTRRNEEVRQILNVLPERQERIGCIDLKDLNTDGKLGLGVRIGTFDRAKGMEFRAVFIPRLGASRFPLHPDDPKTPQLQLDMQGSNPEPSEEEEELRQLNLDRLYVAMTRARDRLYLIADEQPCPEIEHARDRGRLDDHHAWPDSSDWSPEPTRAAGP